MRNSFAFLVLLLVALSGTSMSGCSSDLQQSNEFLHGPCPMPAWRDAYPDSLPEQIVALMSADPHDGLDQAGLNEPSDFEMANYIQTESEPIYAPALRMFDIEPASNVVPFRMLAILVEFSDKLHTFSTYYFDSLMFSPDSVSTGLASPLPAKWESARHYYSRNSFGRLDIVTLHLPSQMGWQTAPQTHAYYEAGARGMGGYPRNTQKLCEDLVDLVDPFVNFVDYDNDGNGYVDGLTIVHTGTGAEQGGSGNIWSHKWGISPRLKDGVRISSYSIQPEYWVYGSSPFPMTLGVYVHEWGHIFGLPDLYDTDGSSNGVGRWSVMGSGSWGGTLGSQPALFDAWCAQRLGFRTIVDISGKKSMMIRPSLVTDTVYRVWANGQPSKYYYLLENRADGGIPLATGSLAIWQIDDAMNGSASYEWCPPWKPMSLHPVIRLIEADGHAEMCRKLNAGNAGDVWPWDSLGVITNTWNKKSRNPSTWYDGSATGISVSSIARVGTKPFNVWATVCTCDRPGDMNSNGTLDTADFRRIREITFEGWPDVKDPGCTWNRADVNCDGVINLRDVLLMTDIVIRKRVYSKTCDPCLLQP